MIPHRPTHDWIVAKRLRASIEPFERPALSGIYQPKRSEPHHYAEVVAVGPGRVHPQTGFTAPLPCKVGDVVMIRSVAGDPETIDGVEYHWLIPDEIMAVADVVVGSRLQLA